MKVQFPPPPLRALFYFEVPDQTQQRVNQLPEATKVRQISAQDETLPLSLREKKDRISVV